MLDGEIRLSATKPLRLMPNYLITDSYIGDTTRNVVQRHLEQNNDMSQGASQHG